MQGRINESEVRGRPCPEDRSMIEFLHGEALRERVCSELEQLNYAQILTSLALGPSSAAAGRENTAGAEGNGVRSSRITEVEERVVFSRRQRRQVKPTKKLRELLERNEFKSTTQRKERTLRTARDTEDTTRDEGDSGGSEERKRVPLLAGPPLRAEPGTAVPWKKRPSNEVKTVRENDEGREIVRQSDGDNAEKKTSPESGKNLILIEERNECMQAAKPRYKCSQCEKSFKTYYTYSIHIRMPEHTVETPFVCDICGKGFRLSSTLCRHKIIHTSEKPHRCKVCSKTFNRSSTLKMHMRTHSARKEHVCAECGKGFHQKGNLRNHMFVHSGERPFRCEACGRHFNKKSNLKHHIKIHELSGGNLACTVCKTRFQKNEELQKHVKIVHSK